MFMSHYATEVCKCPNIFNKIMESNYYLPPQCEVIHLQLEGTIAASETEFMGFKEELKW